MIYIRDNWLHTINMWQYFNSPVLFRNFDENDHLFYYIQVEFIQCLFSMFTIKNFNTLSAHAFTYTQSAITTEHSLLQYLIKMN